MPYRTIDSLLHYLPSSELPLLPTPVYNIPTDLSNYRQVGLGVASMKNHTTDEGWTIFKGLEQNGWKLYGYGLPMSITHIPLVLKQMPNGGTMLIQDEREWDVKPGCFRESRARFNGVEFLQNRPDIFKLTILKDAHQRGHYHRHSAEKMGVHAWVCYYNPRIVKHLASWVREEHLIRTYHSINSA